MESSHWLAGQNADPLLEKVIPKPQSISEVGSIVLPSPPSEVKDVSIRSTLKANSTSVSNVGTEWNEKKVHVEEELPLIRNEEEVSSFRHDHRTFC